MFISYSESVANGFLSWSRYQTQKISDDNGQPGGSTPVSRAHPLSNPDASNSLKTGGKRMTVSSERVITFAVAGIFGAGRLARRLTELESVDLIGPWQVGHWIDCTHKAIRIRFSNRTDARTAVSKVGFLAEPPPLDASP